MVVQRISIRRLSVVLVLLLVCVMTVATVSGAWVLHKNYRTAEGRFESEANETLQLAAIAVRNQIRFFTRVLELIAKNPAVGDLAEFADEEDAVQWSRSLAGMLPGSLATALATVDGVVIGNPISQRVGPRCESDLKHFANGVSMNYPPIHRFVPGMEHFDLMTPILGVSGEETGVLFLSFRLSVLQTLFDDIIDQDQRFTLSDPGGFVIASSSTLNDELELREFSTTVPGTDWQLRIEVPHQNPLRFYAPLVITDLIALCLVSLFIYLTVRRVMRMFQSDIQRIHNALVDVHNGVFTPSWQPSRIAETEQLLPDIEALAQQLQDKHHQLTVESVTDPLTGAYNRRYFNLMIDHDFEQSTRQMPSILVLFDLNDFKHVNDKYGHAAGDAVLLRVATFLQQQVRASDSVVRMGGDEFAIILHNMSSEAAPAWLKRLLDRFEQLMPKAIDELCPNCLCSLSAGMAPLSKKDFASPRDALKAADRAMYRAKQDKNNKLSRFCTYNPEPESKTAIA